MIQENILLLTTVVKKCNKCGTYHHISAFHKSNKHNCKSCVSEYNKAYYKKNKYKILERRHANKNKTSNNTLLKNKKLLDMIAGKIHKKYKNIDLEDLKQEAFVKGLEVINDYDNNRACVSTFMYNKIYGHLAYMCKRKFQYIEEINNYECPGEDENNTIEDIAIYNADFNDILLKTDINQASDNVKNCVNTIYSMPVKKPGIGVCMDTKANEVLTEMKKRNIPNSLKAIEETREFILNWN